jgi:5'-nucleotidase
MLRVAVSSRALFNLEDGNDLFNRDGWEAFDDYMRQNEHKPLRPGVAFQTIKKLLALNAPGQADKVSIMLLSSNTLEAGARVLNSAAHYGLTIDRAFFTSGGDRCALAKAGGVHLFLSTNPIEVRRALADGIPAANVMPKSRVVEECENEDLCIAFDGDAVLFSDEAEQVNQAEGLLAFEASEARQSTIPLGAGPFKQLLLALHSLQRQLVAEGRLSKLRIALVTARGPRVYSRVLHTFRDWGVRLDHAYFLGGAPKGPFLGAMSVDLFMDDGLHNIESASPFVSSCHIPHGVLGTRALAAVTPD